MAASGEVILKILSGVQAGMDILLVDGTYSLGSGDDDDIQLFDVSLLPGHARLNIRQGKVELAGTAGQLKTRNGTLLAAASEFQEIEPLDVVSAGTARFVLGAKTSNWASIADTDTGDAEAPRPAGKSGLGNVRATLSRLANVRVLAPAAVITLLLLSGVVSAYVRGDQPPADRGDAAGNNDVAILKKAFSALPFRDRLRVDQEIDGVVYVNGFVETPVERRAVLAAVRDSGVPARVRISVQEVTRQEIAALLEAEGAKIDFGLSGTGAVTLTGTLIDEAKANGLTQLIRERILGISAVTSELRTGPMLLDEIRKLAERSQITPLVILRLDGELIEASGAIPNHKIDAWAGFLQAYAGRFASSIPLRSLVSLQDAAGNPIQTGGNARYLGAGAGRNGDVGIDPGKLQAGNFELDDILVGRQPAGSLPKNEAVAAASGGTLDLRAILASDDTAARKPPASAGAPKNEAAGGAKPQADRVADASGKASPSPAAATTDDALGGAKPLAHRVIDISGKTPPSPAAATNDNEPGDAKPLADRAADTQGETSPSPAAATNDGGPGDVKPLEDRVTDILGKAPPPPPDATLLGRRLLERWRDGLLDKGNSQDARLLSGMQALEGRAAATGDAVNERYAPLLARAPAAPPVGQQCWAGSRLSTLNIVGVVFWLDLLSASTELTISNIDAPFREELLEAALNPDRTSKCVAQATGNTLRSVYLYEISRNSGFIRHIFRDLASFPLEVAGASVAGDRYVLTRDGNKLREGAAPDQNSRLLIIGELGIAVERSNGYETVLFGPSLNWMIR